MAKLVIAFLLFAVACNAKVVQLLDQGSTDWSQQTEAANDDDSSTFVVRSNSGDSSGLGQTFLLGGGSTGFTSGERLLVDSGSSGLSGQTFVLGGGSSGFTSGERVVVGGGSSGLLGQSFVLNGGSGQRFVVQDGGFQNAAVDGQQYQEEVISFAAPQQPEIQTFAVQQQPRIVQTFAVQQPRQQVVTVRQQPQQVFVVQQQPRQQVVSVAPQRVTFTSAQPVQRAPVALPRPISPVVVAPQPSPVRVASQEPNSFSTFTLGTSSVSTRGQGITLNQASQAPQRVQVVERPRAPLVVPTVRLPAPTARPVARAPVAVAAQDPNSFSTFTWGTAGQYTGQDVSSRFASLPLPRPRVPATLPAPVVVPRYSAPARAPVVTAQDPNSFSTFTWGATTGRSAGQSSGFSSQPLPRPASFEIIERPRAPLVLPAPVARAPLALPVPVARAPLALPRPVARAQVATVGQDPTNFSTFTWGAVAGRSAAPVQRTSPPLIPPPLPRTTTTTTTTTEAPLSYFEPAREEEEPVFRAPFKFGGTNKGGQQQITGIKGKA